MRFEQFLRTILLDEEEARRIPGLPASRDPLAPMRDKQELSMGLEREKPTDLGQDELETGKPPPSQDAKPAAKDRSLKDELKDTDLDLLDQEPGQEEPGQGEAGEIAGEEPTEEKPTWQSVSIPNKKDRAYRRSDGFMLRMRPVESVPGKWIAQVWNDDKVLDKGQLMIPKDVDPDEYVQKMADYMLDGRSNRYEQQNAPSAAAASSQTANKDNSGQEEAEGSPSKSKGPGGTDLLNLDAGESDLAPPPEEVGTEEEGEEEEQKEQEEGKEEQEEPQDELDLDDEEFQFEEE